MTKDVSQLQIGFIGHGRHAQANLYPSIALAGARVCNVVTRTQASAQRACQQTGAERGYTDVVKMLNEETLDAVFISVEPEQQATLAQQCLAAGVSVFVEKPAGLDGSAAQQLAADADAPLMVGFMKRYAPVYQRLAELVQSEAFGRTMTIEVHFAFAPWSDDLGDEGFLRLGAIHMVDLVRALCGEVIDVAGASSSAGANIGLAYQLTFANGAVGSLVFNGVPSWGRERERVTVTGSGAWAMAEDLTRLRYAYGADASDWRALESETHEWSVNHSPMAGGHRDLYLRGFAGEVAHFLSCVAEGRPPQPDAADNLATTQLCDRLLAVL